MFFVGFARHEPLAVGLAYGVLGKIPTCVDVLACGNDLCLAWCLRSRMPGTVGVPSRVWHVHVVVSRVWRLRETKRSCLTQQGNLGSMGIANACLVMRPCLEWGLSVLLLCSVCHPADVGRPPQPGHHPCDYAVWAFPLVILSLGAAHGHNALASSTSAVMSEVENGCWQQGY